MGEREQERDNRLNKGSNNTNNNIPKHCNGGVFSQ